MRLGRNGHLSELAIERLASGEHANEAVSSHLERCALCRETLQNVTAHVVEIPPLLHPASVEIEPPLPTHRARWFVGGGVFVAAMVAALFFLQTTGHPPSDDVRIKGSDFAISLYANDGEQVRPLADGDVVRPKERVGFRVENGTPGFLAIVGFDNSGESYVCYPQRSRRAKALDAGPERTLEEAIRMDDRLGRERIVAIFCHDVFDVEEFQTRVSDAISQSPEGALRVLYDGCEQREVSLVKE